MVVTSTYLLGHSTTQRLLDRLAGADLVVAEPEPGLLDALGLDTQSWTVAPGGDRAARCSDPLLTGLEVRVDARHRVRHRRSGCFTGEHGHLVAMPRDGVTLLGASKLLTNDQVLRADNAAVALRLLGQHDRLVWYVPEAVRPGGRRRRQPAHPGARVDLPGPLDRRRHRARPAAVARTAPRAAGHRAAARSR